MSRKIKLSHLILSLVGPEQSGLLHAIAKLCKSCHCLITSNHATQMGETLAIIMQLSGTWSAVAKLEACLPAFEKKWSCQTLRHRTDEKPLVPSDHLPYTVQVVTLDRIGVLSEVTKFFYQRKITLQTLNAETFQTSRSPAHMCTLNAVAMIPTQVNIATLREQFMLHCEEHNLDAILEPQKLA